MLLSIANFFIRLKKDIAYFHTNWECASKDSSRCGNYLFNNWNLAIRELILSLEVNAQAQEALKKCENDTLGISFQYSISAAILNEGIVRPIIELLM